MSDVELLARMNTSELIMLTFPGELRRWLDKRGTWDSVVLARWYRLIGLEIDIRIPARCP